MRNKVSVQKIKVVDCFPFTCEAVEFDRCNITIVSLSASTFDETTLKRSIKIFRKKKKRANALFIAYVVFLSIGSS